MVCGLAWFFCYLAGSNISERYRVLDRGESSADRLVPVQGDRSRVCRPTQITTPPGEGVAYVDRCFYRHHVSIVVRSSRVGSNRTACRLVNRQGDNLDEGCPK